MTTRQFLTKPPQLLGVLLVSRIPWRLRNLTIIKIVPTSITFRQSQFRVTGRHQRGTRALSQRLPVKQALIFSLLNHFGQPRRIHVPPQFRLDLTWIQRKTEDAVLLEQALIQANGEEDVAGFALAVSGGGDVGEGVVDVHAGLLHYRPVGLLVRGKLGSGL